MNTIYTKLSEMFGKVVEIEKGYKVGEFDVGIRFGETFYFIKEISNDISKLKKIAIMTKCFKDTNEFVCSDYNLTPSFCLDDICVEKIDYTTSYEILDILGVYFIVLKDLNDLGWINKITEDIFEYPNSLWIRPINVNKYSEVKFI